MGIYGALSTAVTGLRAQSFALENISGNIANSQTTGFKRIDTDFIDLIPEAARARQTAGSVLAQSRATNNLQGDVRGVSTETYMAINGSGFFIVEPRIGTSDGNSIFAGANYYTRRGDFDMDKSGYLVNGAGQYLKGLPIDAKTGNISGSVPQVLQLTNSFLPAVQTTRINYQLNLPQMPNTAAYQLSRAPGSELLNASDFINIPPNVPAAATGGVVPPGALSSTVLSDGDTLSITIGSTTRNYTFNSGVSDTLPAIDLSQPGNNTIDQIMARIEADLVASGAAGATVTRNASNQITVNAGNLTDQVTVAAMTAGTSGSGLGFTNGTFDATISNSVLRNARVPSITANDSDTFVSQSIWGGAITAYAASGAPTDVQMRWAKVNSTTDGGADRWNLFVLTNANATGTQPAWTAIGGDFTFGANGLPNPPVESLNLANLTVNGVVVGDVRLQMGATGLSQFADPNGTAEVTTLNQNGYAAGQFVSVAINDSGRVVVTYNNGQQLEVAQVVTANFNAPNALKRMDGGVFAATSESGEPIFDNEGGIIGASLEASNTDISEEFTKLIVTQQAYAAGTRIVSTADEMMQEVLNMVR